MCISHEVTFSIFVTRRNSFLTLLRQTLVALLSDRQLDAGALGQADVRLVALANHKDVSHAGGESVAVGVFDVNDVEGARMPLSETKRNHN